MNSKVKKGQFNLFIFVISRVLGSLGTAIFSFAISLYILKMTGSSAQFSFNLLFSILPSVLLAPIAGNLADRIPRKWIVIIAQIFSVSILLVIYFILSQNSQINVFLLYSATFSLSLASLFSSIALTASIANLVETGSIQKAVSFNQSAIALSGILGPILGGVLFGIFSIEVFFVLMSITAIITLVLDSLMDFTLYKVSKSDQNNSKVTFWNAFKESVQYIKNKPNISSLIYITIWINFFSAAMLVGLPFLAIEQLGMSSHEFGFIEAMPAVGMLIMSLIFSQKRYNASTNALIRSGLLLFGVLIILLAFPLIFNVHTSVHFIFILFSAFLIGVSIILVNNPISVLLQSTVEDYIKGRVFGVLQSVATIMSPLGLITYGYLFEYFSTTSILLSSGLMIIVLTFFVTSAMSKKSNMSPVKVK